MPGRLHRAATAGCVLLFAVACGAKDGSTARHANQSLDASYVGRDACGKCHLTQYTSYARTGMGRSFYPVSPDNVVEDFEQNNELFIEETGLHYTMVRRGDRFFQRQYLLDSRGEEIAADEHELLWVVGSNNHTRSYLIEIDGGLFQAPVCWYPQERIWALCPGYEEKNDHFARDVRQGCLYCHNGVMVAEEGERNRFERPFPHGIGCERCHGPGELHVERWSDSGAVPTGGTDTTIVNPRRLPAAERVEVCFQCHLGDAKATERVIRHGREFTDYRPGQRLTDYVMPLAYAERSRHDFGIGSQGDRMMMSRCYVESAGALECLTCHNPHVSTYSDDLPQDLYRNRCLGCHDVDACSAPAQSRKATAPLEDDCVACHMRRAEPDDHRFTTFTDHWIRRDIDDPGTPRESLAVAPLLAERFGELAGSEQAYYKGRAAAMLALDTHEPERSRLWAQAARDYEAAIAAGWDDAAVWYFLGKARRFLQDYDGANRAFDEALARDPTHHDALYARGQSMLARSDAQGALAVYRAIVDREPDNAVAQAELARALAQAGRPDEGLERLDRALAIEPWNFMFHLNRSRLLARVGRMDEAAQAVAHAVRLNPDHAGAWLVFEKVNEAAGNTERAAEGRRLAERLRSAR